MGTILAKHRGQNGMKRTYFEILLNADGLRVDKGTSEGVLCKSAAADDVDRY